MSPNTLRKIWKETFGEEAFVARGKKIQAEAATATCLANVHTRTYKDTQIPCSKCDTPVLIKAIQVAHLNPKTFICDDCKYDRACPVCGLLVDGEQGLSMHFRHRRKAGDTAHSAYQVSQDESYWANKKENLDYVVCQICGYRAKTLASHLKPVHGMSVSEYQAKFSGALIRPTRLTEKRQEAAKNRKGGFGKGEQKAIECPSCGAFWKGSKFLVPTIHDFRCGGCRSREESVSESLWWLGKTEPDDYVECRLCGWKGENITGHLIGVDHPGVSISDYRQQFPQAPLYKAGVMVFPTHKANLTEQSLTPFKDKKGCVQVALAADSLGLSGLTIRNYCKAFNLPTRNRLAFQKRVLDSLSNLLGVPYNWEWFDLRIYNPKTGYHFYFDGYFPTLNLLVEVHGAQHFKYIPYWHKTHEAFKELQERDDNKLKQALGLGFRVLVIRYDEPYTDVMYLKGRLK